MALFWKFAHSVSRAAKAGLVGKQKPQLLGLFRNKVKNFTVETKKAAKKATFSE